MKHKIQKQPNGFPEKQNQFFKPDFTMKAAKQDSNPSFVLHILQTWKFMILTLHC